jgi:hypothetical protein
MFDDVLVSRDPLKSAAEAVVCSVLELDESMRY